MSDEIDPALLAEMKEAEINALCDVVLEKILNLWNATILVVAGQMARGLTFPQGMTEMLRNIPEFATQQRGRAIYQLVWALYAEGVIKDAEESPH